MSDVPEMIITVDSLARMKVRDCPVGVRELQRRLTFQHPAYEALRSIFFRYKEHILL
ncbi:MAG: hypothetical protein ACFE9L_12355 [Candidatus Hodarchaeota archaeon]